MLMSASSEFVALCREQLILLTQGLGASLCVVYLTQELVEAEANEAKLVPVVVYPEIVGELGGTALVLPNLNRPLLTAAKEFPAPLPKSETEPPLPPHSQEEYLLSEDKIVLPLIHEDLMMGLLVTVRKDRAWKTQERTQVERFAQTLSLACILDQRRAWLQQQLRQHEILQQQQRDLLDNLMHQFRNPLTALRTFGKLLLKRLRPADVNWEVASSIIRESDRLNEMLQQFNEVINLRAENLEPLALPHKEEFVEATAQEPVQTELLLPGAGDKKAECLVGDVLEPLLVSARAIALERNLQLIADIPPNLPKVSANAKALREVLSNIVDNALKYTPAGGKILVQAGLERDNFQGIAISDNGPGIPTQDLEHLGERYYRGVQAQTEIPGTGLGLAIAKQLVEQMQGEIQVFSPAPTSVITSPNAPGTIFIIWLPVANSALANG
jgi:signal transduction histidine kinase